MGWWERRREPKIAFKWKSWNVSFQWEWRNNSKSWKLSETETAMGARGRASLGKECLVSVADSMVNPSRI